MACAASLAQSRAVAPAALSTAEGAAHTRRLVARKIVRAALICARWTPQHSVRVKRFRYVQFLFGEIYGLCVRLWAIAPRVRASCHTIEVVHMGYSFTALSNLVRSSLSRLKTNYTTKSSPLSRNSDTTTCEETRGHRSSSRCEVTRA